MSGSPLSRGLVLLGLLLGCGFCAPAKPPPSPASRAAVSPQALVGNWFFQMKVGGRSIEGSLHFSVAGGILAGSLTSSEGGERELKNLEIKDDRVSWDMEGPGGTEHATGTVEGSSMKGTLKRTAARRGEGGDRSAPPPAGGGMGRTGGGGRGGGRGRSGGRDSSEITWSAFKTVGEACAPPPAAQGSSLPSVGRLLALRAAGSDRRYLAHSDSFPMRRPQTLDPSQSFICSRRA